MDLTAFEDGLDRYGGDLLRWPAELRAGAEAVLRIDAAARAELAALEAAESGLRAARRPHERSPAIARLAAAASRGRQTGPGTRVARRTAVAATMAAALAVGVVLGGLLPDRSGETAGLAEAALSVPEPGDVD